MKGKLTSFLFEYKAPIGFAICALVYGVFVYATGLN